MVSKARSLGTCGLCGEIAKTTREHVLPKNLCPPTRRREWRPIIIPTCERCNNGSSDDDAHFRNVVVIAGTANDDAKELWEGPVRRALHQVDGRRRVKDVYELMSPAPDVGPEQYRIFPARDERVLKIIRKITRGLCFHHGLPMPVPEEMVFCDVLRVTPDPRMLADMTKVTALYGVFGYSYGVLEEGQRSVWLLEFFDRTKFVALVGHWEPAAAAERIEP